VVQELHLVATHVLCEYVDQALPLVRQLPTPAVPAPRDATFARWAPPLVPVLPNGSAAHGHSANGHTANSHGVDGQRRNGHHRNGSTGTGWVQS
ncbi:hypothetical protein ABZ570_33950, partial [Micromonospora sp. NPDC007271]